MRNPKALAMLILSVVIGLGAAFFGAGWLSQQGAMASNKVVVAAVDVDLGSRLNPQMLSEVEWPSGSVPSGAFRDVKTLQDRVAKTSIMRGEAILEAKLAPVGTKGGLSAVIGEGKRAITVKVNEVIGVAGFVVPGTRVDVMVTLRRESERDSMARVVVSDVQVLTAGTRYDQEKARDGQPIPTSVVTLLVTPPDAERIALAATEGQIMLTLRNPMDRKPTETAGIRTGALLGQAPAPQPVVKTVQGRRVAVPPPAPAAAPAPKLYTVEAIRAAKRAEEIVR
jgi:pilus assembly protein CpaB